MTLCANKLHLLIGSISIWAFMNLEAWLTHKIYDDTIPKILKSLIKFAEFLSACEISDWLTPSLSKYSCFQKSAIWLIGRIFDPTQIKITNHLFNSYHRPKNHADSPYHLRDMADLKILKSNWPRPFHKRPDKKLKKLTFTSLESISACQKLS